MRLCVFMKMQCYNINRPFHLGRRDCFFEQGLDLIRNAIQQEARGDSLKNSARIMYCLKSAYDHSVLAKKADSTASTETHFLHCLQALINHLLSLTAIVEFGPILGENGEGSELSRFMEQGAPENARPAQEFCAHSRKIENHVYQLCLLLDRPFQVLKAETLSILDEEQKRVYETARRSLGEHLAANSSHSSRTYAQIAYPVLETRSG